MKKVLLIALVSIMAIAVIGCASATWQKNLTTSYQATGLVENQIYVTAKGMCDAGTLKPADCTKIRTLYNKIQKAYVAAGGALILAIDAADAVTQKNNLAAYTVAINDLMTAWPDFIALAQALGVTK